jgi:hypothetical protein
VDAVQIRFGDLIRVYGRPAKMEGHTFCAADIDMYDEPEGIQDHRFYLADYVGSNASPALRSAIRGGYDISWTIARIMRVFFIEPDTAEYGRVLNQGFVAVPEGLTTGYPFRCRDHVGRSHLQFSVEETAGETCGAIAGAFWRLLLYASEDLEDFSRRVCGPLHEWSLADPLDLEYGCKFGHLYRERPSE